MRGSEATERNFFLHRHHIANANSDAINPDLAKIVREHSEPSFETDAFAVVCSLAL